MSSLRWDHEPVLHDPVLVCAFTGWNDAADAATDAVDWLAQRFVAQEFATIDEQVHVDFQAQRPVVTLVDGVTRDLSWPQYSLRAAATADGQPDLVMITGPEPNYDWRGFCRAVVETATALDAKTIVTFGALLADSPHTRPPRLTGSATDAETMDEIGLTRSRYEGPTGIIGVLHDTCRRAGFRSASLWVPVPHYVAAAPNPPAISALLDGFGRCVNLDIDRRELIVASDAWRARVDEAVGADDDLKTYVRNLEAQPADASVDPNEVPSGESLAEAFEEYLREQGS